MEKTERELLLESELDRIMEQLWSAAGFVAVMVERDATHRITVTKEEFGGVDPAKVSSRWDEDAEVFVFEAVG